MTFGQDLYWCDVKKRAGLKPAPTCITICRVCISLNCICIFTCNKSSSCQKYSSDKKECGAYWLRGNRCYIAVHDSEGSVIVPKLNIILVLLTIAKIECIQALRIRRCSFCPVGRVSYKAAKKARICEAVRPASRKVT